MSCLLVVEHYVKQRFSSLDKMRKCAASLQSHQIARRLTRAENPRRFQVIQALPALERVPTHYTDFNNVDIEEFRQKAFFLENPLLMTGKNNGGNMISDAIPAAERWFQSVPDDDERDSIRVLSSKYLDQFGATVLPYELNVDKYPQSNTRQKFDLKQAVINLGVDVSAGTFHRFNAPLSLFLEAYKENPSPSLRLYIAQAQIADLPKLLQEDLPTPKLVLEAGKGDVYDANIWIGMPPTYTPLHKDPNPNLFVQLASSKRVRLFNPDVGLYIFRNVQRRIGGVSSPSLRGHEMMEGPERELLRDDVWSVKSLGKEGFEAIVGPGDALFIPKGWWHSMISVGSEVNASVNWWFR